MTTGSNLRGNTIKCPACGHHNQPLALYCQSCGTALRSSEETNLAIYNPGLTKDGDQPSEDETQPSVMAEAEIETQDIEAYRQRLTQKGTSVFDTNTFLRIQIVGSRIPLIFRIKQNQPLVFGRGNLDQVQVHIDLTPFKALDKGVSRRHAAIDRRGKRLFLWDLESSNGTYLNGVHLEPHQRHQLRDGDEICLGQLTFHLFFQNITTP